MIGPRSASAAPSMSNARTAQTAIKAIPTASRVAATSTASRLNFRRRSSLVLNMADRSTLLARRVPRLGSPGIRSECNEVGPRSLPLPMSALGTKRTFAFVVPRQLLTHSGRCFEGAWGPSANVVLIKTQKIERLKQAFQVHFRGTLISRERSLGGGLK